MSALEQVGEAYLAGSRNSLKIVIDDKCYFVNSKAIARALKDPKFRVHIHRLVPPEKPKPRQLELTFSVTLRERAP